MDSRMIRQIGEKLKRRFKINRGTSSHDRDLFDALDKIAEGVGDLQWLSASAPHRSTREAAQEALKQLAAGRQASS